MIFLRIPTFHCVTLAVKYSTIKHLDPFLKAVGGILARIKQLWDMAKILLLLIWLGLSLKGKISFKLTDSMTQIVNPESSWNNKHYCVTSCQTRVSNFTKRRLFFPFKSTTFVHSRFIFIKKKLIFSDISQVVIIIWRKFVTEPFLQKLYFVFLFLN